MVERLVSPLPVDARLLRSAYDRLPLSLALSLAVIGLFAVPLWPVFPHGDIGAWAAVLVSVIGLRMVLWLCHRHWADTEVAQGPHWRVLFVAGALLSGMSWAYGPFTLIREAAADYNFLLALTVVGVAAVSMGALVADLAAMWLLQSAMLLPTAWRLMTTGGKVETLCAAMVIACLLTLMMTGRAANRAARRQLEADAALERHALEAGRARERAERASIAKSRFLANMSHELRTPLNAVIGAAQLIENDQGDAVRRAELTAAIRRSGTNLLALIENILDLSRIEAGELHVAPRDFHLVDSIEAVLATGGIGARAKGLALACIVEAELPAWRHGDSALLRQVVLNLLGNAIKFTPAGEVVVHVREGAQPSSVCIDVRDTGIGVPPEQQPHVFEPFRQAEDGADRRFGGTGLGLAIVAQIAQALGGTVRLHSEPGRGSCFSFELPLPAAVPAPAEPPPLGLRVAYVEPHEAGAQALDALLRRMGCTPRRCRSAAELRAWAVDTGRAPDAWLLLDSDGPDLLPWLEAVGDTLDPRRIVALTSAESDAAFEGRSRLRLPRPLLKPVTRTALASRLLAAPAPMAPGVVPAALCSPAQLAARTRVLVVEDDRLNQAIACRLLEHAGYLVEGADDGQAALQALRESVPDIVLMDWQMPDMDGVEVTRRVRAGEAGEAARNVPIVALTANAFADDREICLAAGMNDFLTKPIDHERLLQAIERWRRRDGEPPRLAPPPPSAPAADAPPVFDPAVLRALPMVADGSDPGAADEMLALFVNSVEPALRAIEAAQRTQDRERLLREVHTLKSGAAAVGALAMAALAQRTEAALRTGEDEVVDPAMALRSAFDTLRARLPAASKGMP
jgi:signal transduction histidine kinase/CheY-like chemotaxis protein/HPt (histidine-containing phosphotransfer) domain-containing protein